MERAPHLLVPDASVVVKWFIDEPDSEKALLIRKRYAEGGLEIISPDLVVYETVNAIARTPTITGEVAEENCRSLLAMELDLVPPSSELMAKAASMSGTLEISACDSAYLSLADYVATYLVTADEKLQQKIVKLRKSLFLRELGKTWELP